MTKLQKMRKRAGLTQAELARECNVSIKTIQALEIGQNDINKTAVITVIRMAEALGCTIYDIIEAE